MTLSYLRSWHVRVTFTVNVIIMNVRRTFIIGLAFAVNVPRTCHVERRLQIYVPGTLRSNVPGT